MFIGRVKKQLDPKRRFVLPQDYRTLVLNSGTFEGVYSFPSLQNPCLEAGGQAMFDRYVALIDRLDFGDPERELMEHVVYSEMQRLAFDAAGRITLPETLCAALGLEGEVEIVGLGHRFQLWNPATYAAYRVTAGARSGEAVAKALAAGGGSMRVLEPAQ